MDQAVTLLSEMYFTKIEAQVYTYLLENPGQTVYEISKSIRVSRSSIYPVIDKLSSEGIVLLESGPKELFYAQEPHELISMLDLKHHQTIDKLKNNLSNIKQSPLKTPYFNINGFDAIIGKARTLLYEARQEVYMNTDLPLSLFEDAFDFLNRKGVDVYVFSFVATTYRKPNVFIFSHNITDKGSNRLMLVSDLKSVLVANNDPFRETWQATYTQNYLMVQIVSEHIHHDIYLIKLKQKLNQSLFETYPDLAIHTKAEKIGTTELKNQVKEK